MSSLYTNERIKWKSQPFNIHNFFKNGGKYVLFFIYMISEFLMPCFKKDPFLNSEDVIEVKRAH